MASAFAASDFLPTIFSETVRDFPFTKTLGKWLSLTNEQESPLVGALENWTQLVFVNTVHDLVCRIDEKNC